MFGHKEWLSYACMDQTTRLIAIKCDDSICRWNVRMSRCGMQRSWTRAGYSASCSSRKMNHRLLHRPTRGQRHRRWRCLCDLRGIRSQNVLHVASAVRLPEGVWRPHGPGANVYDFAWVTSSALTYVGRMRSSASMVTGN